MSIKNWQRTPPSLATNDVHRIRMEYYTDEHATLKSMATRWNVSVATISNALKGRGAYRDVPVVWTDPLAPM